MKAKFFLAATLALVVAIGSANANPVKLETSKTTTFHNNSKSNKPVKHHRHHRKHRRHHVVAVRH